MSPDSFHFLSFVSGSSPLVETEADKAGFPELTGMLYWMPLSSNQLAVTICRQFSAALA